VLSCDFSKSGHLLATASDDNMVRMFDLRKRKCLTQILAHQKTISEVEFDRVSGRFLMTASYDKNLKLWCTETGRCAKVLVGHEQRVMGAALCPVLGGNSSEHWVASVAFDRTFKLWRSKSML